MTKNLAAGVLFICCLILLTAADSTATIHQIQIGNNFFSPLKTTVAYGDTVRWVWDGGFLHSTTSDVGSPKIWDSGTSNAAGFTFDVVFLAADGTGPFPYHCSVHSLTMKDTIFIDNDGDGVTADLDCRDDDPNTYPGAAFNDSPTECMTDLDNDGYGDAGVSQTDGLVAGTDCNDGDPNIHPGATDIPGNGIDEDCDGFDADFPDNDQDGYKSDVDCDDNDPDINPGATEVCNGVDDDCDGFIDDDDFSLDLSSATTFYRDSDDDGYGDPGNTVQACTPPSGYVADGSDCHDGDPNIHPGAFDIPGNGIDEDCDGFDAALTDNDLDGYTSDVDCDDNDSNVNPGATEVCNGIDDDCDGFIDDDDFSLDLSSATTFYRDSDDDGYGDPGNTVLACSPPSGYVADGSDCNDSDAKINPAATDIPGNGIDEDCDGFDATGVDDDNDGYTTDVDCDDTNPDINPGATEVCNGVDDDCDGFIDDDDFSLDISSTSTFYLDSDNDGYGDFNSSVQACSPPLNYVADGSDCHDGDLNIHPGAFDIPDNGIDEDCDGFDATSSCCIGDRGNINGDINDEFDISDIVYFVDFMFNDGDPISCEEEADVVVDSSIDIGDAVYLIDYMFNDGPPPPSCN